MVKDTSDPLPHPVEQILEEARIKYAVAQEHVEDLSRFGFSNARLDEFQSQIDVAQSSPTYQAQLAQLKALTAVKDAKLQECVEWGRELRLRLNLAYRNQPIQGLQFPSKEWTASERSEAKMITLLPLLIQIATEQAAVLSQVGGSEADVAQGQQLLQELIEANQAQEAYNLGRTQETAERRAIFWQLYDTINTINQLGQAVYSQDPAKARLFQSRWSTKSEEEAGEGEDPGAISPAG